MRLKYFLRGAGTGVIVTAILFLVLLTALDWGPRTETRTTAEQAEDGTNKLVGETGKDYIEAEKQKKEEAQKTEETAKTEADKTEAEKTEADKTAADITKADENVTAKSDPEKTETAKTETAKTETAKTETAKTETAKTETTDNTDATKKPEVNKTVSFSIRDGEGSDGIANNLKTLGLVDDAKKFNEYLAANGYDRILRTGNFKVPMGLSYKELAELLCKKPE